MAGVRTNQVPLQVNPIWSVLQSTTLRQEGPKVVSLEATETVSDSLN